MNSINYHNITNIDQNNGDGLRVVLWVSGCYHHCNRCQNPQTWDFDSGILYDNDAKKEIFDYLKKDYISGITLSGGDPLAQDNIPEILELVKEIKDKFPDKTIWVYSGYTYEDIIQDNTTKELLSLCDVLIDGEFVNELKDVSLKWRGSSNQRVIDLNETRKQNKIILHCD